MNEHHLGDNVLPPENWTTLSNKVMLHYHSQLKGASDAETETKEIHPRI